MTTSELDQFIVRQGPRDWDKESPLLSEQLHEMAGAELTPCEMLELLREIYLMGYNTGSIRTTMVMAAASN